MNRSITHNRSIFPIMVAVVCILALPGLSLAAGIEITNKDQIESKEYDFGATVEVKHQGGKPMILWISPDQGATWYCVSCGNGGTFNFGEGEDASLPKTIDVPIQKEYTGSTAEHDANKRQKVTFDVSGSFIFLITDYPEAGFTKALDPTRDNYSAVQIKLGDVTSVSHSPAFSVANPVSISHPHNGSFSVSIADAQPFSATLLTLDGREVARSFGKNGIASVHVRSLITGMYIVNAVRNGAVIASEKITVHR